MSKKGNVRKRNERAMAALANLPCIPGTWHGLNNAEYNRCYNLYKEIADNLEKLKAYLRQETIPYLKNIMKHAAQNEHDIIYKTNLKYVNNAARELRECIQGLRECIQGLKKYIGRAFLPAVNRGKQ